MSLLLLVVIVLVLFGGFGLGGYAYRGDAGFNYGSGGISVGGLLLILLILYVCGVFH